MFKRSLLFLSLLVLPLPALADRGYRDHGWGHDRQHFRGHGYDRDYRPRPFIHFSSYSYDYPEYHPYRPIRYVVNPQPQVIYVDDESPVSQNNTNRYCREYYHNSYVGGSQRQTYGTACLQPDGSWEIIN
jgi:hypothetical protein